ncbi:MAG: ABC transporter ATP-binding protein, partial [Alphaproteobacteria bacterium]|nr:ABC transporter ATP-binding protein [Alphaproteobacteria bacterium]
MRLEVDHVSHRFQRLIAVDDVSLGVGQGETLCLLGPSGCGKSTLLRLIAGLEDLQAGRIRIDGETVAGDGRSVPAEARGVGMVFQDYALFPHLTVLANAAFGLDHLPDAARFERARALLTQMGLEGLGGAYPHTLSGGEQQRVALARALAPEPHVLLLDEPFAGLDVRLRDRLREDTLHLLKQRGTTSILVTHDPEEAMFMGDRIAVLLRGRIVQEGSPVQLYRRPVNAFVARFFGEINCLRGRVRGGAVATPLGSFAAPGLADGTDVEVIVRP